MKTINRVNCRACGGTHFGLWSADGETVQCPVEKKAVYIATGKVVEAEAEPVQVPPEPKEIDPEADAVKADPEPEAKPEKPAPKKATRRTKKTAKK